MKNLKTAVLCFGILLLSSTVLAQKKLIRKGDEAFKNKDYYCAIKYYGEAYLGKGSTDHHVVVRLAQSFQNVKRYTEALTYYEKASQLDDATAETLKDYAQLLMFRKRYAKARNLWSKYTEKGGDAGITTAFLDFIRLKTKTHPDSIQLSDNHQDEVCYTINGYDFIDLKGDKYDMLWELSDGFTTKGFTFDHCFTTGGPQMINLHLLNKSTGVIDSFDRSIPVQVPYSARYTFSGQQNVGKPIAFDASNLKQEFEGEIATLLWDFGDGNYAIGETASHEFSRGGHYTVKLYIIEKTGDEQDALKLSTQISELFDIQLKFLFYSCSEGDVPAGL